MLRIFIISQNEPFYIPKMMRLLVENQGEDYQICGYTILNPTRKNKGFKDWFLTFKTVFILCITNRRFGIYLFKNNWINLEG